LIYQEYSVSDCMDRGYHKIMKSMDGTKIERN